VARAPNLSRRADLEAALERAGPKDVLRLEDFAKIWGTSKQNFVNTLREIEKLVDVPDYQPGPRGTHLYPARKMLQAMIRYEKRNDEVHANLAARARAIMGGPKRGKAPAEALLPISEMAQLSRVMAETEAREREQGLYIPVAEVQEVAGRVFGVMSAYLSELDAQVDPNGILSTDVRTLIRDGGRGVALNIHAEMKHMLNGDASPKSRNSPRAGSSNGSARKSRAGRQGKRRVPRKAG
jgi:hypothetical protein